MKALVRRLDLKTVGRHGWFPVLVLFGLNAVDELDQAAFNVLAPEIRDAFGLSNAGIVAVRALLLPLLPLAGLGIGYLVDRRRRTRIARTGAAVWALFAVATAVAPAVGLLMLARVGAGIGRQVNQPTHQALLADYYPPEARAGAFSLWRMGNPVGQMAGPLLAGVVATFLGWRPVFVLMAVPTAVLLVLSARLKEPTRGLHDRRAGGADEELAGTEEDPPTWDEAWRTLNGVRTLRRLWRAIPFLIGGILGIVILLPLFYEEVFGASEATRGLLAAVNEPFQVLGLMLGIPVTTKLLRTAPERVMSLCALAATVAAAGFVVLAAAPSLVVAAVAAAVVSVAVSILTPGFATLASLIIPPRARGFGFSVNELWIVPGMFFVLAAAMVGDAHGLRWGVAGLIPVFLLGGYIAASAGSQVRGDIRAAQLASAMQAESKLRRENGDAPLLMVRSLDVRYGPVQVLFGVDLEVRDGEIVALLGTNGAGKSTLLKAIAGLVDPAAGGIVFDGRDATHTSPQAAARRGIVLMPGGKATFPTLTVEENLRAAGWLARQDALAAEAEIEDVLRRFPRLRERFEQPAGNLSGGEQQMLGLGMALVGRPRLLMIDELSLGLAPAIVQELLGTVREIHAKGTTVVIVEQSVNVALSIAQRAVFLEKGEVRFEGPAAELLDRPDVLRSVFLAGATKGLAAPASTAARPRRRRDVAASDAEPLLELRNVSKSFGGVRAVSDLSFSVRPDEILGIIGPNGAGKTTVFDLISGFLPPDEGEIRFLGEDVTSLPSHVRARRRLGRSFQDARLFPSMTVKEAIAVAHDRKLVVRDPLAAIVGLPDHRAEERILGRRVDELIELLGLGNYTDKFLSELSTGTRRIVDLACVLAHDPALLLFDEPSSGIAQREAEALGPLLAGIRQSTGTSLVVIEHDIPLVSAVSDRMIALDLGSLLCEGSPDDVLSDSRVVAAYLGTDESTIARSGSRPRSRTRVGSRQGAVR